MILRLQHTQNLPIEDKEGSCKNYSREEKTSLFKALVHVLRVKRKRTKLQHRRLEFSLKTNLIFNAFTLGLVDCPLTTPFKPAAFLKKNIVHYLPNTGKLYKLKPQINHTDLKSFFFSLFPAHHDQKALHDKLESTRRDLEEERETLERLKREATSRCDQDRVLINQLKDELNRFKVIVARLPWFRHDHDSRGWRGVCLSLVERCFYLFFWTQKQGE